MKIEYKTTVNQAGEPCKFDEVRNSPCCEEMGKASSDDDNYDCMNFGETDSYSGVAPVLCLTSLGYYGDHTTHYHPICFCPFCGAKVVCEEIERVKIIETKRQRPSRVEYDVVRTEETIWKKEQTR